MKKVLKFVKGRREDRKDGGITPSQSGDLVSPAQTPDDERFLGLDTAAGYIVDFCGKDKTLTKLHKASWQGNLEKVKSALKKVDIDAVDRHNRTALHFAVVQGHPNIVWFLLGSNARHTICDSDGRTALLKAVECSHKECMSLLLERGTNINHADFSGSTSLHLAVKQGAIEVATILLQKGADVGIANNNGDCPLHIAMRAQNKEMVQLLLRCEAPVNAVDRENRTPLMLAAKSGNLALAQLFFEYGAQLYVTDSNGWTAEDYALLGGHQNVASELKSLMKKDAKPVLETHREEDEGEPLKSDADTWNDSHQSGTPEPRKGSVKMQQFLRKCSAGSDRDKSDREEEELVESPGSGVVPPPCQPPRSWEIIEAGMIDEASVDGSEPKRRSITALGSLHSRRESFTENSGNHCDGPKYTLSLNRRKDPKKTQIDGKQRFSFNEEDSLKSSLSDDFSLLGFKEKDEVQQMMRFKRREKKERQSRSNSGSDWDSNLSSLLESSSSKEKRPSLPVRPIETDATLNEIGEIWVQKNPQVQLPETPAAQSTPLDEEQQQQVSSGWDSSESHPDALFPPPPTAFELGVDMAKSITYIKGISIDHVPGSTVEHNVWRGAQSLDCLDEKEPSETEPLETTTSNRHHSRNPSISSQKWRSVELPQQQRPQNRLLDVNRRINDQLECYDQALRELAESTYDKRQSAIISTLTEPKTSKIENYYSLPSSKFKDKEFSLTGKTRAAAKDYAMSLPLQFGKRPVSYYDRTSKIDLECGPPSLPFEVNTSTTDEVENNEKLGFEDNVRCKAPPTSLDFAPSKATDVDNLQSPMSDEPTSSDNQSDKKSKRHMLLAMRDVKHAVQVTNSFKTSLDEHILSPLTKLDGEFDLSPKKLNLLPESDDSPVEDRAFFRGDSDAGLGRQETVIERVIKSSPSDSGDEPTLWLQDKAGSHGEPSSDEDSKVDKPTSVKLSPEKRKKQPSSASASALRRLQRLSSSSDNEDSVKDRVRLDNASPDLSLSSGPIEPLGRDSGSDPDSSHQEVDTTPVHHYSLKKHHKWLKDRLQTENKERQQLEEVAAQLAEKAERLQYELADAKEATKSRDEIIGLLQSQLNRMEAAYTKSLEESVHCRLQLTTLEQEILHLKELCSQYEDEQSSQPNEANDKQGCLLLTKIKKLEEEREGLSRVVVRLEQENRTLEKAIKESGKEDGLDESMWTERRNELPKTSENCQLETFPNDSQKFNNKSKSESCQKLLDNEEINQSIQTLARKNREMEEQLKFLIRELNEKQNNTATTCQDHDLLVKSHNENYESLKCENMVLNQNIKQMQDEIFRLNQRPNVERLNHEINELSGMQPSELNTLRDEVATLRKELEEAKLNSVEGKNAPLKARVARDDELAWSHLYGIKSVRNSRIGRNKVPTAASAHFDKDSEEFIELKVRELEQELEKAKDEILRQRLESQFRMQAIMPSITQSLEINTLENKVKELEMRAIDEHEQNCQQKAELAIGLRDKRQLELEMESLKNRMQREYVPKIDADVARLQVDLLAKRFTTETEFGLEEGLKEKFENLARERERAETLRRRLGRQCISWETGMGPKRLKASPLAFHSLPREKPASVIEEKRQKLPQASAVSKNRQKFETNKKDLPSELVGLDTSSLKIELLKQKYLS